jgi:hypothetical protein
VRGERDSSGALEILQKQLREEKIISIDVFFFGECNCSGFLISPFNQSYIRIKGQQFLQVILSSEKICLKA